MNISSAVRHIAFMLLLFFFAPPTWADGTSPDESRKIDAVRAYIERTRDWANTHYLVQPQAERAGIENLSIYRVFPDTRLDNRSLNDYPVDVLLDGRTGEVIGERAVPQAEL